MKETKVISCKVSTSLASLMGNATAYARYFLTSKFPPEFFKKTYISDSLSEIQMEDKNVQKFPMPTLIITPEYTGENGFMDIIPYWHTAQYFTFKNPRKKYNGVLFDEGNDMYIYSIPDRVKLNFNVKIKLPSQMYAYNVLHYIKQLFEVGGYFYLNDVRLQTEVPKMYIEYIKRRLNLDTNTPDGREALEDYLLKNSYNGLTEKINLSSGNSAYSYNYKTNILVNFPDMPSYDKNSNGMIVDNTTISFSFSFDFWSHSNFIMELKDNVPDTPLPNIDDQFSMEGSSMKYEFFVPTKFIREQEGGMHMLTYKPFVPDVNTDVDILDFSPIINSEVKKVIGEAIKNKLDMSKLMSVMVLVNNQQLIQEEFNVNWENLTLETKHPMYNVTYTIVIYGNLKSLNLIEQCIIDGKLDKIATIEL